MKQTKKALLAGGCFWGMEEILRVVPGILSTEVGYSGGHLENPTYKDVKNGNTGHAECLLVEFDPERISYEKILEDSFFKMHDPTTLNQQGNDVGSQYRSAIFYFDEDQKQSAEAVVDRVNRSGFWKRPVVTDIVPAQKFYSAEDYHQDYLRKKSRGIHLPLSPKMTCLTQR